MSKNVPLVSVVMPVYNSEKHVGSAIESVLRQTFKVFEFIIVDDCSIDGSLEIIKKYSKKDKRIVIMKNSQNLGISESRNAGLARAKGQLVMNMDHDDICAPGRMRLQAQYLKQHPDVGIVGSDIDVINDDGKLIGERSFPKDDLAIRKMLMQYSPFAHPSTMIRSTAYARAGKYAKAFEPADDYELYFRVGKFFKFGNLPAHLLKHRIHRSATTMKRARLLIYKTLKAKWRGAIQPGCKVDAMVMLVVLGQLFSILLPSFALERIVRSQYKME